MMNTNDEIRTKTEAFAADIAALVKKAALEAVLAALGGEKAAKAPAPRAPAKKPAPAPAAPAPAKKAAPQAAAKKSATRTRPLGAKRPPAEISALTEKLFEYIKANPNQGIEVIGKALGTPTSELNLPVKKLLASKRINFTGERRATKYSAV